MLHNHSYYDKYKIFTPFYLGDKEAEAENDPYGYNWEWKPDTPQSVIDEYNDPDNIWNLENDKEPIFVEDFIIKD